MPATEAQIRANQANALKSSGPKTPEGKDQSRRNALKHGLTGAGVVLIPEDASEFERRVAAFQNELKPSGEVGVALVRRAATMAVRMESCAARDLAAQAANVRQAMEEFVAPKGVNAVEADRLRVEAGVLAMFDSSKEASLARKYESAAERAFFRALKELRQVEKAAKVAAPVVKTDSSPKPSGSFLPARQEPVQESRVNPVTPSRPVAPVDFSGMMGPVDVPFTIGRAR